MRPLLSRPSFMLAFFVEAFATGDALACSGPDAAERIAHNERIAWLLFAVSLVLGAAFALMPRMRHHRGTRWSLLVLAVVHPGWWMGAGGDCGVTLLGSACLVTLVTFILACVLLWRTRRHRKGALPARAFAVAAPRPAARAA